MKEQAIRSCDQLLKALASGDNFEFLFFWGHRPSASCAVTKSCLSQWYEAPFVNEGKTFHTAEHFMMVRKAELFSEPDLAAEILAAPDPGKAKSLGRKVARFNEDVWKQERWRIVVEANLLKFAQHQRLASFLKGTGSSVLVEASPLDSIWGIGLDAKSPDARNPAKWQGLNLLGFALMEVRDELFRAAA